jgi:flagellar biosynthetic protein FliO
MDWKAVEMERSFRITARAAALCCLLGLGAAGATPAADTSAPPAAALPSPPDTLLNQPPALADEEAPYLEMMAKLGLGLALVILLAWGSVFLLRRSAFGRQFGGVGQTIRVVERFYLGPKKAIYLVEIGGRPLALGVTDAAITPLTQWQAGELDLAPRPPASPSFADQFRGLLGQARRGGQEG